jgi:hypothetical protein
VQCLQNAAQYWCENGLAHILVEFNNLQSIPGLSSHTSENEKNPLINTFEHRFVGIALQQLILYLVRIIKLS